MNLLRRLWRPALMLVLGVAVGALARATGAPPPTGLTLVSEQVTGGWACSNAGDACEGGWWLLNYVPHCLGEDSEYEALYEGSLAPDELWMIPIAICSSLPQWTTIPGALTESGGLGLRLFIDSRKPLAGAITTPSGFGTYETRPWDGERSVAARCVNPTARDEPDMISSDIEGGVWQLRVHNASAQTVRNIRVGVKVYGAWAAFQRIVCPQSDWNIKD